MGLERGSSYHPKVFAVGELPRGFERIRMTAFDPETEGQLYIRRKLADGTEHSDHRLPFEAATAVCNFASEDISISVKYGQPLGFGNFLNNRVNARISSDSDGYLHVRVEAESAEEMAVFVEAFERELGLTPAPPLQDRVRSEVGKELGDLGPPLAQLLDELRSRIEVIEHSLEQAGGNKTVPITCFLSFQFTAESERYANEVARFLTLLDVRVITGKGYEPKPITEKVRDRLSQGINFIVLIEVAEKKSSWTRDEIAATQDPDVFLVPLVEEGATFDAGIYGNHEYISFPRDHISDAFISLLEAVNYIRRLRAGQSA